MDESIYNEVSSFKEYESILSNISPDDMASETELCRDIIRDSVKYRNYNVQLVCQSVMNYLNKLKDNVDDSYKVKGCKYLYYALYDMAEKKNTPKEITYMLYNVFMEKYDSNKGYKCDINIESFNLDIFETLKNLLSLYDYFFKYEKGNQCNNKTCNCAEECVKIYNKYVEKCNNHYSSSLCTELNKFAEKFNNHLKQDKVCKDNIKKLDTLNCYNLKIIILIAIILIFVISFSFFILYKFTPFRSKLNNPRRTKTKMYNNFDQKLDHMQNTPKYVKGKSINKSYNLSYYSEDYT
ncbi:PIR protein [Plasmodium vivax]|uniref:VIR protein n=1 Tax=Plasmodium vivax TaxID=5855 RepID=A0A565A6B0_PLAVI|nr:PIR protein [Plasmodium vivax]